MEAILQVLSNTKVLVSIIIGVLAIIMAIVLAKKYHLSNYQILIFILLVCFWFSIIVARDYRKAFAALSTEVGGLNLGEAMAATVASAYGLVSIFARISFFGLADLFRTRKFFIALSLGLTIVSSILVFVNPCYQTLLFSSLCFGLGASLLAMFNVIFADTFKKDQAMASVSILSIAPLIAELLVAPFQYYATMNTPRNYTFLWAVSAITAVICLVVLLFIKEQRPAERNFSVKNFKIALTNKSFMIVCVVGVLISFIKFATSGSNMTNFSNLINMDPMGVAYLGVVFSVTQLVSGVLMGTLLTKKIGVKWTLIIGVILSGIFSLIGSFITNPTLLFISYALNGIGYGLTYNVLIGIALSHFERNLREVAMGIFQTFFAVGIFFGDKIYNFIIQVFGGNLTGVSLYQRTFLITAIVALITVGLCFIVFRNKPISVAKNEK